MSYVRSARYPELFQPAASKVWWCFLPSPSGVGKKLRRSTGQRDERAAYNVYRALVRQPVETAGGVGSSQKERSLGDALDARINWLTVARLNNDPSRKKPSEATVAFYTKKSRVLNAVIGSETLLSEIDHEMIRKYIERRAKGTAAREGVKATTIAKELVTLSMAMKLARKDGVRCEAFRDIKPEDFVAIYVPRTRSLTFDEAWRVLGDLPAKRAATVAFCLATGATFPSEVDKACRGDVAVVDENKGVKVYEVHIKGTKRGTRDRRFIVPSDRSFLLEYALMHAPGGKVGLLFERWSNVRQDLLDVCERLSMCKPCRDARIAWGTKQPGAKKPSKERCKACEATPVFPAFCPTDLRRTFAQWLVEAGVPYELAYPMMGHADDRMLKAVYGKRKATAVSELVEAQLKRAPKAAKIPQRRIPVRNDATLKLVASR